MSIPNIEKRHSPETTYRPAANLEVSALSRKFFFISMGSAAAPVLVAAGIMLQSQHAIPSKSVAPLSAQQIPTQPIAPRAGAIATTATAVAKMETPHGETPVNAPTTLSTSLVLPELRMADRRLSIRLPDFAAVTESPPLASEPFAGLAGTVGHPPSLSPESPIYRRENLFGLASLSTPSVSFIPEAESVTVEERSPETRTAAMSTSQVKKIRAELKGHAIVHHRHRPQKHAPPTLLAKIGQSVKKGLLNVAKFPRQAMAGHLLDQ